MDFITQAEIWTSSGEEIHTAPLRWLFSAWGSSSSARTSPSTDTAPLLLLLLMFYIFSGQPYGRSCYYLHFAGEGHKALRG